MNAVQLEFNINDESSECFKLSSIQKQIDDMNTSIGKVRRKLFSEVGELKNMCEGLKKENEILKQKIRELTNEKTEWVYEKGDSLFDVREFKG